jgi:hypothetical protein
VAYSVATTEGNGALVITYINPVITTTFAYTGAVQTFTAPDLVTSITVVATGSSGGAYNAPYGNGGKGAIVRATIAVTPGVAYSIYVGGAGESALVDQTTKYPARGYNGGGRGSNFQSAAGKDRVFFVLFQMHHVLTVLLLMRLPIHQVAERRTSAPDPNPP